MISLSSSHGLSGVSLRKRDVVAISTCLFLLRLAFAPPQWDDRISSRLSSVNAAIELAFYAPYPSHPESGRTARPVPLDIDGDGVYDALVMPAYGKRSDFIKERDEERKALLEMARRNKDRRAWDSLQKEEGVSRTNYDAKWEEDGSWGIRVLNLRPLHRRTPGIEHADENAIASVGPFVPRTMFLIPLLPDGNSVNRDHTTINVYPVKIQTMHMPIQHTRLGDEERLRQRHRKETNTMTITYGKNSEIPPKNDPLSADYDWTRHYFCGRDWHHASQVCHRHCGGGQSSECGDGETCYADTPCDVNMEEALTMEETSSMALTKSGTLPGVVTVWSDGGITLHVVTADVPPLNITHAGDTNHRTKRTKQNQIKRPELELRQLWRVHPLEYSVIEENSVIEFYELGIAFESGVNKSDKGHTKFGNDGAVILGCRYALNNNEGDQRQPSKVGFHALNAMTGISLWDLKGDQESSSGMKIGETPLVPIIHTTSSARRRSHLPTTDVLDSELDNENAFVEGNGVMTSTECISHFRSSVFDKESGALPHEFWGDDGELGSISVGRFDQTKWSGGKRMKRNDKKGQNKHSGGLGERHGKGPIIVPRDTIGQVKGNINAISRRSALDQNSNWRMSLIQRAIPRRLIKQHRYSATHAHTGRPNVVLFHGREGLAVLSLKNGRPVCHVSLMDGSLYADIDEDGMIDTIQVVTSPKSQVVSGAVASLIQRFAEEADELGSASIPDAPVICHALVTSGLPPREELFTAPLCLGGPINRPQITSAPPLLVEGSMGYGNDVVFAMNNGVVVRYDFNGREIWRKKGGITDGTPSWHSGQSAFLGRLQFGLTREIHSSVSASSHRNQHRLGSPLRPILLSADDGAVLISPTSGNVLASVVYPQLVKSQPTLADLSGDGTDDLLVVSDDAIWGYHIVVDTDQSGYFVIIVVTLLIGVAVAVLIHKMNLQSSLSPIRNTEF